MALVKNLSVPLKIPQACKLKHVPLLFLEQHRDRITKGIWDVDSLQMNGYEQWPFSNLQGEIW